MENCLISVQYFGSEKCHSNAKYCCLLGESLMHPENKETVLRSEAGGTYLEESGYHKYLRICEACIPDIISDFRSDHYTRLIPAAIWTEPNRFYVCAWVFLNHF